MGRRAIFPLILGLLLVSTGSGCCWVRRVLCNECCDPCDRGAFTYYAGDSCGDKYCGDWKSHPPKCDPCDDCGLNVGCSSDEPPIGPVRGALRDTAQVVGGAARVVRGVARTALGLDDCGSTCCE